MASPQDSILSTLHSPALKKALASKKKVFDEHTASVNQITADIKNLENYLRSSGVCVDFALEVNDYEDFFVEGEARRQLSWTILWAQEPETNQYRLMCRATYLDDWEKSAVYRYCPLIEAPLITRLALFRFLDAFVAGLADRLTGERPNAPRVQSDDEIPF